MRRKKKKSKAQKQIEENPTAELNSIIKKKKKRRGRGWIEEEESKRAIRDIVNRESLLPSVEHSLSNMYSFIICSSFALKLAAQTPKFFLRLVRA